MNLASSISDGVLALASLAAARALQGRAPAPAVQRSLDAAAFGLLLIGAAALCGTLRFAGLEPLAPLHDALSQAATAASMPTIGLAALAITWPFSLTRSGWIRWLLALAALVVGARLTGVVDLYGLVIGALGTLAVIAAATRARQASPRGAGLLSAGAGLVLIAGLAVGTSGELGPFARLDVFHYLLALADVALAFGLLRLALRGPA